MKSKYENEVLTVFLEGKIDSVNAGALESELMLALAQSGTKKLVVDADQLDYISSAGLRVLLKARKKLDNLPVINVSNDVYDIFDVTGFTDLLDVHKRLRRVSVEGCEMIGSGGYGRVFRIDPETIVKLYDKKFSLEEVQEERNVSQKAFLAGIPTAISYDVIRSMPPEPDCYGVVYEMLNARTVAQIVEEDPSLVPEMGAKCGILLKNLHNISLDKGSLSDRKQLYYEWLDRITPFIDPGHGEIVRSFLDSIPDRNTFLHGDFNSKNIMVQDGEFVLIDIGDATLGHPVFDMAGLLIAYLFLVQTTVYTPEEKRRLLGFRLEDSELMLGSILGGYFGIREPEEIKKRIEMIMPYGLLQMAYSAARSAGYQEEYMKNMMPALIGGQLVPVIQNPLPPLDF